MEWIHRFDLFLFDFDGLLVDTEKFHYEAYIILCRNYQQKLNWSFEKFCEIGHASATALRDTIYQEFPSLYENYPDWSVLYAEKKQIYLQLISEKPVDLMPGAMELLYALEKADLKRVVVTHSPREQIDSIKTNLPILSTIPYWITREDYLHPKPAPDSYSTAIERFGNPNDRIIGFEDSIRGLSALKKTGVMALHITTYPSEHPFTFPTLSDIQLDEGFVNNG